MALDVDGVRAVHEDVGDLGIAEEGVERAEPEQLEADLLDETLALGSGEIGGGVRKDTLQGAANMGLRLRAVERRQRQQVHALEELPMHLQLQLLIRQLAHRTPSAPLPPNSRRKLFRTGRPCSTLPALPRRLATARCTVTPPRTSSSGRPLLTAV